MTTTASRGPRTPAGPTLRRAWTRLTEGQHPWGGLDINPGGRGGWSRTRLTVYPPGTNAAERRRMNAAHTWPITGAVGAILVLVALDSAPQVVSFLAAVLFYGLGFAVFAFATRRIRPRVRYLTVSVVTLAAGARAYGDVRLLRSIVHGFGQLDAAGRAGGLSPVAYEARWAALYERIPEATAPPVRERCA